MNSPSSTFRIFFVCRLEFSLYKLFASKKNGWVFFSLKEINFECLPNFIYLPIRVVSPQRRVWWTTGTSWLMANGTLVHEETVWILWIIVIISTDTEIFLFRTQRRPNINHLQQLICEITQRRKNINKMQCKLMEFSTYVVVVEVALGPLVNDRMKLAGNLVSLRLATSKQFAWMLDVPRADAANTDTSMCIFVRGSFLVVPLHRHR